MDYSKIDLNDVQAVPNMHVSSPPPSPTGFAPDGTAVGQASFPGGPGSNKGAAEAQNYDLKSAYKPLNAR